MLACDAVRALALGSVVLALWADELTLVHLGAVALIEGTGFVFHNLAQSAAVRHVVHQTQLPAALGRNEARERAASLLGAPLGGVLFGLGRAVPFLFDALSYLASIATLLLIRSDFRAPREEPPPARRLLAEVAEGVGWLWREPFLRATAFLVAGSNMLFSALVLVLIVLARDGGSSPAETGLILSGAGVGGVLGSLLAARLEAVLSMKRIVIGANWVWALLTPLLVLAPGPLALGAISRVWRSWGRSGTSPSGPIS
jgi:predicted MFS family arabinose efflux permease